MKKKYEWRVLSDGGLLKKPKEVIVNYTEYSPNPYFSVYESGLEAEKGLRDYFEKTKGAFNAESDFILVEMYMEEE